MSWLKRVILLHRKKLAWIYDRGIGVRKSYKKSFYWYEKSIPNGNPIVYYNLGLCYLLGQGTAVDYKQAFYWTKKAAEAGYADGMLALGWHYHNGFGTRLNDGLAHKWYRRSLKQKESGAAYFSLGQMAYHDHRFELAAKYFSEAVNKFNHPGSCYYWGRMYFEGKGVRRDDRRAGELLTAASRRGVYPARRLLNSKKFSRLGPGGFDRRQST